NHRARRENTEDAEDKPVTPRSEVTPRCHPEERSDEGSAGVRFAHTSKSFSIRSRTRCSRVLPLLSPVARADPSAFLCVLCGSLRAVLRLLCDPQAPTIDPRPWRA